MATETLLEALRAVVLAAVLIGFSVRSLLNRDVMGPGWRLVWVGLLLLFVGAVLELVEGVVPFNQFVSIGDSRVRLPIERLAGYAPGFIILVIGFTRWLPTLSSARRLERQLTETRESDERHRRAESRYRALLEAVPDGIFIIDNQGIIQEYLPAKGSELAAPPEEFLGQPVGLIVPSGIADLVLGGIRSVLRTGSMEFLEYAVPIEGRELQFEARLVPLGADRVLAIVRDISERKELDRMKDLLITTINHELRTPLTSLKGALSLLAEIGPNQTDANAGRLLQIALRNTDRLVELVQNSLDLERMRSGEILLLRRNWPAHQLISRASHQLQDAAAAGTGIHLIPGDARVTADGDRVVQILVNLLRNAITHSPPGGVIRVAAAPVGEQVRFEVTDEGPGIAADRLNGVFEPFSRLDGSDARSGGAGLSLSICRRIVEAHGGRIWVESAEGEGSTFAFTLPASPDAVE